MGRQRVKFSFPADMVKEPVIYRLGRDFEIVTNIRRADVREDIGWVILDPPRVNPNKVFGPQPPSKKVEPEPFPTPGKKL